ncbi:MarR family transcriptional regulator [Marinobacter lipolyticus]|uniref:MarR family winged helix-turn-helix transcriptional regulator n=1 Tax=Marinobacter lipolyticus TaxID=209639 RepID=UPI001BCCB975|nr:MarR family transcriptional regulator [Marinobacter lipolyticus]MBS8241609.1 MarR family transcriptional regulator [Marinobacter lipolyticus]
MMASDDDMGLDNQLCFALYAANRAVVARYRPLLSELGLTYPQYLVMLVLWEAASDGRRLNVSDLGGRLRLDSGTLTPLLKRLQQRGLISRTRSKEDERIVSVGLTDAGKDLRAQARAIPGQLLCATGVAPERLVALRDELRSILAQLESPAPNGQ